jgi:hypothetical protein
MITHETYHTEKCLIIRYRRECPNAHMGWRCSHRSEVNLLTMYYTLKTRFNGGQLNNKWDKKSSQKHCLCSNDGDSELHIADVRFTVYMDQKRKEKDSFSLTVIRTILSAHSSCSQAAQKWLFITTCNAAVLDFARRVSHRLTNVITARNACRLFVKEFTRLHIYV